MDLHVSLPNHSHRAHPAPSSPTAGIATKAANKLNEPQRQHANTYPRRRTTSNNIVYLHNTPSNYTPSIYSNPSPATSAGGKSPMDFRSELYRDATGGFGGVPYRMVPGKPKADKIFGNENLVQQPQNPKSLNILAPVPRRHLIDGPASSQWLSSPETPISSPFEEFFNGQRAGTETHAQTHGHTLQPQPQRHHSLSPTTSKKPFPRSSQSPVSPIYINSNSSLLRNRAQSYHHLRNKPSFSNSSFPGQSGTSSTGTNVSTGMDTNVFPRRRVSTQSFGSLYEESLYARERRKRKGSADMSSSSLSSTAKMNLQRAFGRGKEREKEEDSMGRAWIRWMHKRGLKSFTVSLLVLVSLLVKFGIGLGSYSGYNTPPMYGDYEAQRHWMELTLHLPFRQWYTYDLQYWGLDYPPLTAYVSWLCGIVAHWINPSWVALFTSRGHESPSSKLFIRSTVVVLDTIIYLPSLLLFLRTWQGNRSGRTREMALMSLLFQPALLLIDFGHFQYNGVMLGFTLLAIDFFAMGWDLIGAICFVMSLGFKQMALYYAPAIGSYLLAKCIYLGVPGPGLRLFIRLAVITALTFLVLFLPFLLPSPGNIIHPITRIFPFARGLFEDKVANWWCATNVVLKWRERMSRGILVKLSAGLTGLGFLPSVVILLGAGWRLRLPLTSISKTDEPKIKGKEPTQEPVREKMEEDDRNYAPFLQLLPYALFTSSLAFFLFSFQVHEKTILVPLMPVTLLLSGAPMDSSVYAWGMLVNNVAVFSMWPLLKKDGLGLQYFALLLLWNRMMGYNPLRLPSRTLVKLLSLAIYAAIFAVHIIESVIQPPARYPDLYPVLNVLVSTPVFMLAWLWSIKCGIEVGWALGGLGTNSNSSSDIAGKMGDPADKHEKQTPKDERKGLTSGTLTEGSYKRMGGRAISLGYAGGKPNGRGNPKSRASSLSLAE